MCLTRCWDLFRQRFPNTNYVVLVPKPNHVATTSNEELNVKKCEVATYPWFAEMYIADIHFGGWVVVAVRRHLHWKRKEQMRSLSSQYEQNKMSPELYMCSYCEVMSKCLL